MEGFLGGNVITQWSALRQMRRLKHAQKVSPGLYRSECAARGGIGGGGGEWDDLAWFRERGLDFDSFKLAEVAFQTWDRGVGRFQATYSRLDNPEDRVVLPCRGRLCIGRLSTVVLAPSEDIKVLCTVITEQGSLVIAGLETTLGKSTGITKTIRNPSWKDLNICELRFRAYPGFAVAGFWGHSGDSLDTLGVYFKSTRPERWSVALHCRCPPRFRRAVRELLLAHKRLGSPRWRCGDGGCGLGSLPLSLVLLVVEKLNEAYVLEEGNAGHLLRHPPK